MDAHLFLSFFIYVAAAAIAAPLGRRLGLGSVLGYLAVGAVMGPYALGFVGEDKDVLHFAEFGVVLMLFVIGLELNLSRLWKMRGPIFGLGGLQVIGTSIVIGGVAAVFGISWREAIALGLILSLSSTAIVMQTLNERRISNTSAGNQAFAVLLFQDIAVIPILAFLPLLAVLPEDGESLAEASTWFDRLAGWQQGGAILGAVALIVIVGRFLLNPWLGWVARLKVTEALTATTLALVIGVALLMDSVGLSPALGTFVAGVILASSHFRHELESDIEPFKALLLAVFFLAVGASIDFPLIARESFVIAAMVALLISLKFLILFGAARVFNLALDQKLLFAAALAQGGEFAFVLGGFAVGQNVISQSLADQMIASVALSMALAPVLLIFVQKVIVPRVGTTESDITARPEDEEMAHARVLLAGFGRFGHPIIRLLRSAGETPTVLESDSDHVDFIRGLGMTCYYGDATRLSLLKAAGAEHATLFIVAIDDEEECLEIVSLCQTHFPKLTLFARACSRNHAYRLHQCGVQFFIEQIGSSLDCAVATLQHLGHEEMHAKDAARRFKEHELEVIGEMSGLNSEEESYREAALQNIKDLESLLDNAPLPNK